MSDITSSASGWTERARPPSLSQRFAFPGYAETRAFLDQVAALSEESGIHPDIGFGRDYASLTIHAAQGGALSGAERAFARRAEACARAPG